MRLSAMITNLSIFLLFFAGCGGDMYKSAKLESSVIVDGHGEDWTNIHLTYIED